jgi:hypothetical protein
MKAKPKIKKQPPPAKLNLDPKVPVAQQAVMNVDKGEEIAGMWSAPEIPNIGIYKLIAKKKVDGTCEWAHYIQRANGLKDSVFHGTVENPEALKEIVDIINKNLRRIYGPSVALHIAQYQAYTLDGTPISNTKH